MSITDVVIVTVDKGTEGIEMYIRIVDNLGTRRVYLETADGTSSKALTVIDELP
jgi:hypothetical protein